MVESLRNRTAEQMAQVRIPAGSDLRSSLEKGRVPVTLDAKRSIYIECTAKTTFKSWKSKVA
jgi:hypothetical protein